PLLTGLVVGIRNYVENAAAIGWRRLDDGVHEIGSTAGRRGQCRRTFAAGWLWRGQSRRVNHCERDIRRENASCNVFVRVARGQVERAWSEAHRDRYNRDLVTTLALTQRIPSSLEKGVSRIICAHGHRDVLSD